jgi:hypothetical protein
MSIYQHYKGSLYKIMCHGTHTETLEKFVIYSAIDNPRKIWIRPAIMFYGNIRKEDKEIKRFKKIK